MKALITAAACLVLSQPAFAFFHGGHGGGFHGPGIAGGGFNQGVRRGGDFRRHGHDGLGLDLGGYGYVAPVDVVPEPVVEPILPPPVVVAPPPRLCPPPFAAHRFPSGPHIIYIGQRPEIHGPTVIYGTE